MGGENMLDPETKQMKKSNEDEWAYLGETILRQVQDTSDKVENEHGIPVESALDEVDQYVYGNYNYVIKEKFNTSRIYRTDFIEEGIYMSKEVRQEMDSNKETEFNLDELLEDAMLAEEELNKELMSEDLGAMASLEEAMGSQEDDPEGISIEELDQIINSGADENEAFSLEEFDAMLGDTLKEEEMQAPKSASDVFSDSLGAVTSLDDAALEQQFNDLLPDEATIKETNPKKSLMEKMFANIEPENPQEEIAKEEQRLADK
ncbi:MAG: hypothetical protein Q4F05_19870, partial [bacterium]|nr:hypothetical protein [bacterium]